MTLADLINAEPARRGGVKCSTCQWVDMLDDTDRSVFDATVERIRKHGTGTPQLYGACVKMGLDVKAGAFGAHVRNGH